MAAAENPTKLPEKRWIKPPPGRVKLNFDGSVKMEDGSVGSGMVLRHDTGNVIFTACRQLLNCCDPLEAEAKEHVKKDSTLR